MKKVCLAMLVATLLVATPVQAKGTVYLASNHTTIIGGMTSLLDDMYKIIRSLF